MRSLSLLGAAALILLGWSQAEGAAPPSGTGRWSSQVYELRRVVEPADAPAPDPALLEKNMSRLKEVHWIAAEDLPQDLQNRPFSAVTFVAIEVDASGQPRACRVVRASREPRLDALVCDRILADEAPTPLYVGPGRPVPSRRTLAIGWETRDAGSRSSAFPPPPPAPPGPPPKRAVPGPWPRLEHFASLVPVSLPALQPLFPRDARKAEATVSLDLLTSPAEGVRQCAIGISSGDKALDEASCQAARLLDLRYRRPCTYCFEEVLPLRLVWRRKGGSHIRLPLLSPWDDKALRLPRDPANARAETYQQPRQAIGVWLLPSEHGLAGAGLPLGPFYATLLFDASGRARDCVLTSTTRSAAVDDKICRATLKEVGVHPAVDVFGDPVARAEQVLVYFRTR